MKYILLVRYGEIHLKGLNRPFFLQKLLKRMHTQLKGTDAEIEHQQGRIFVKGIGEAGLEDAVERLSKVFGIESISPAVSAEKDWEEICEAAAMLVKKEIADGFSTFKVFARRGDKSFQYDSMGICRELGHFLLEEFPEKLSVDIRDPQIKVCVEIRERAYIYTKEIPCHHGMPTGTAGRAALLISGGIDSPVAGYMMAKRGLELIAVHFFSPPYTSERAKDKVIELTRILSGFTGGIALYIVPFTDLQLRIYEKCPAKETTIIMRRLMMQIASAIAKNDGALALITGEALGQVASQTLEALGVTEDASELPVFRPLIGFDKEEITVIAKRIGTFETSILPYEDCCTIFVPNHPVTRPKLEAIKKSQEGTDFDELIQAAISNTERIVVLPK